MISKPQIETTPEREAELERLPTQVASEQEWQVYRMFDARRGAWSTFQFLIRERLAERGIGIGEEGELIELEEGAVASVSE